jgi:hypothetical protein
MDRLKNTRPKDFKIEHGDVLVSEHRRVFSLMLDCEMRPVSKKTAALGVVGEAAVAFWEHVGSCRADPCDSDEAVELQRAIRKWRRTK